jgi:predicted dehydrogenase
LVEKPLAITYDEVRELQVRGQEKRRAVIEDHNYLFNKSVQRLLELIHGGQFGDVVHVDVTLCLNIYGQGSRFIDADAPHPSLSLPGGAISDFLTHLSYLSCAFVGPHRRVSTTWKKHDKTARLPSDEFCALVDAERGTAKLAFSAHSQPDVFLLQVFGTKMRGAANLFEPRLTLERLYDGPRPLLPILNGARESLDISLGAIRGLLRKLSGGPGAYEGLWELIRRTYQALRMDTVLPVSPAQVDSVNRLITDLIQKEYSL